MDVERLKILRELADRTTVAATAAALNMTPSAVSQQLKVLAREAGVALLEPDGRRVRLTDAGHALVLRAEDVLGALGRAEAEMDSYRGSPRGSVRLAMFPSGAALLLPGVLARIEGVELHAGDEDLPASAVPQLLADYDIVLTHRDERAPSTAAPRVAVRTLMREPIDLVLPRTHRFADRDSVDIHDLAGERWISVRGGFPVDDVLNSVATVTGMQPRVVQRINDFRVTEELVAHGHGVALMPRYASTHPAVRRIQLAGVKAARIYELATRPGADRRPAVATVIDAFVARVAELGVDQLASKPLAHRRADPVVDDGPHRENDDTQEQERIL